MCAETVTEHGCKELIARQKRNGLIQHKHKKLHQKFNIVIFKEKILIIITAVFKSRKMYAKN